jgi:hypothetical protein
LKKIIHALSGLALCLTISYTVSSSTAAAGYLYNNGPLDGQDNAQSISQGNAVSDQFTVTSSGAIGSIDFAAWVTAGDTLTSVDWVISTTPFGGDIGDLSNASFAVDPSNVIASGTASSLTGVNVIPGGDQSAGFDVDDELFSGLYVPLTAGTYWLTLQNAITFTPPASPGSGDMVGWDENDGLSPHFDAATLSVTPGEYGTAYQFDGSNTFELISGTPEPGTVTLFLSGFLFIAGTAIYRKRRSVRS